MRTKYRYPYEVEIVGERNSTIGEMEEFIYDRFKGDFSCESKYDWRTRISTLRFWFEKRDEAMIFKLTFSGGL